MRLTSSGLVVAWLLFMPCGLVRAADRESPAAVPVRPPDSVGPVTASSDVAVSSPADSLAPVADSTGGGPARLRPEAPRGQVYAGRPPRRWWVTVRSGLVPGWGQLANGKPLKAGLLAGLDAYWLYGVLARESDRKAAVRAGDITAVNTAVDRRNFRIWMMGATAIYAMLDAYVDAHFYDYDEGWTGRIGLGPVGQPEVRLAYRF